MSRKSKKTKLKESIFMHELGAPIDTTNMSPESICKHIQRYVKVTDVHVQTKEIKFFVFAEKDFSILVHKKTGGKEQIDFRANEHVFSVEVALLAHGTVFYVTSSAGKAAPYILTRFLNDVKNEQQFKSLHEQMNIWMLEGFNL